MRRKLLILSIVTVAVLGLTGGGFPIASAQVMSSSSYGIQIDSVNVGGGRSTSASYGLESTKGESGTGILSGISYLFYSGFQLPAVAVSPSPTPVPAGAGNAGTRRAQGTFPNVENFIATSAYEQIQLNWINPALHDFAGVRIMRSENFYPADPQDGLLIYSGNAQEFLDTGLTNGQQYYYTAFVYDTFGSFSSGAVTFGVPFDSAEGKPSVPPGEPEYPTAPEPPLLPPELVPVSLQYLTFLDFDFIQNGVKLRAINGKIEADPNNVVTIEIDYDKLPEVLKTIMVTVKDEEGKSFSFLLRVDNDKTKYSATLRPPASGLYPISFVVVDYQNQGLKKVEGGLRIKDAFAAALVPPSGDNWWNTYWLQVLVFLLLALLVFGAVLFINKKLHNKTESEFQMSELK